MLEEWYESFSAKDRAKKIDKYKFIVLNHALFYGQTILEVKWRDDNGDGEQVGGGEQMSVPM